MRISLVPHRPVLPVTHSVALSVALNPPFEATGLIAGPSVLTRIAKWKDGIAIFFQ